MVMVAAVSVEWAIFRLGPLNGGLEYRGVW